mmetsp:Transcript_774/g.1747  ORF Transcript_774/g.1747 Transcript_774/m.1747 type:complete len:349 (-) Transcript_774:285-1331(-)
MPSFSFLFKPNKLKPNLKMAVHRLQISGNKKAALNKQTRRTIAALLAESPPKEEKAKIRAESHVREDWTIEAYEILELQCDVVAERIRLIESSKKCPEDLIPTISTLIWASTVVDIPELKEVKNQFYHKYGNEFIENALTGDLVNPRVKKKLGVHPPSAAIVLTYLQEISAEHGVNYTPSPPPPPEDEEAERRGDNTEVSLHPGAAALNRPTAAPTGWSVPEVGAESDIYVPPIPVGGMPVVSAENVNVVSHKSPALQIMPKSNIGVNKPVEADTQTEASGGESNMWEPESNVGESNVGETPNIAPLKDKEVVYDPAAPPPASVPENVKNLDDTKYDDLAARFENLKK